MKKKILGKFRTHFILALVFLNVAVDQLSKIITRNSLQLGEEHEVLGRFFRIQWVENTGAFLSLGSDLSPWLKNIFLMGLPFLVLIYMLWMIIQKKELGLAYILSFTFIVGGGVSNLIDRVLFGSVTDYAIIELWFIDIPWNSTGVFNIADMAVMGGMFIFLFLSFFQKKENEPSTTASENAEVDEEK